MSEWMEQRPQSEREWKIIEGLLMESYKEQKRARRWGIVFKLLTFAYLFVLLVLFAQGMSPAGGLVHGPHTAVVDIKGVIAEDEDANADAIVAGLRDAFEAENSVGIVLRINSPGGSPVQAGYVYDEIRRLRALYPEKKVYAVISDLGASGGYYIAAAADEIYADKASLVGSIGVTAAGFGFHEAIRKLGIERRNFTSGEHKLFLDPFSPLKEEEVTFWREVLQTTHKQFIEQVRKGRGERLNETPELFSGLIWTGEQALKLGLVDGLGSAGYVAREVIGEEQIVNYTPRPDPFQELVSKLGASLGEGAIRALGQATLQLR
ncbi:MAG: signal peptide peptidase SppA [Gammaproteobacteria bacterium]|nr:MAG: signal peptide peptidase SppA [Gammaproteobacteria bacterium]